MAAWKSLALGCLSLMLLSACAATNPQAQVDRQGHPLPPGTLGPTAVRTLFFDRTVESRNAGGDLSQTYYAPNGTLKQKRGAELRKGTWRVRRDGRMCLAMGEEKTKCRYIRKEQEQYIKYTLGNDGRIKPVVTYLSFKPGNRLGL